MRGLIQIQERPSASECNEINLKTGLGNGVGQGKVR